MCVGLSPVAIYCTLFCCSQTRMSWEKSRAFCWHSSFRVRDVLLSKLNRLYLL